MRKIYLSDYDRPVWVSEAKYVEAVMLADTGIKSFYQSISEEAERLLRQEG
jgi:hypothetical protein